MSRAVGIVLSIAVAATLAGCGNDPSEPGKAGGSFNTAVVTVDGREIPCVTWKAGYAGGLSCDWSVR